MDPKLPTSHEHHVYPPLPQSDRRSPSPEFGESSSKPKGIRMSPLTRFDTERHSHAFEVASAAANTRRSPSRDRSDRSASPMARDCSAPKREVRFRSDPPPSPMSPDSDDLPGEKVRSDNPADMIRKLTVARRPDRETADPVSPTVVENPTFMDAPDDGEPIVQGTPLATITTTHRLPIALKKMEDVPRANNHMMIKPFEYDPARPDRVPEPISQKYLDSWDLNHVRMPCSPRHSGRRGNPIWPLIQQTIAFSRAHGDKQIATFETLQGTLGRCAGHRLDLKSLETLINQAFSIDERTRFLSATLPKICSLALKVEKICSTTPPLLRTGSNASVTMSQMQVACLLACGFFLTFPSRTHHHPGSACEHFPDPNFQRLYQSGAPTKVQKLRCLVNYFERVTEKEPTGVITIRRCILNRQDYPEWEQSKRPLCSLHLTSGSKIEDIPEALQVDFANAYIGGGALGSGCVQEEIRFSICPEMLVSLLLCERMEANECIFLIGCERYSSYTGYGTSFQYAGNYEDKTPKDSWGRRRSHLVAMDATYYRDPQSQYELSRIQRELIKAYVSFRPVDDVEFADASAVATGSWGCGAFNGDRRLKALIQLIAASEAGRPLIYAAYRDRALVQEFSDVYNYLIKDNATVGDLYRYVQRYSSARDPNQHIFQMILNTPIQQIRSS